MGIVSFFFHMPVDHLMQSLKCRHIENFIAQEEAHPRSNSCPVGGD